MDMKTLLTAVQQKISEPELIRHLPCNVHRSIEQIQQGIFDLFGASSEILSTFVYLLDIIFFSMVP